MSPPQHPHLLALFTLLLLGVAYFTDGAGVTPIENNAHKKKRRRRRKRKRSTVSHIRRQLGRGWFKRHFRMDELRFWRLHSLLEEKLKTRRTGAGCPNGQIPTSLRLSMALRIFAGGAAVDIALSHGVHPCMVWKLVWKVVDAINDTFVIEYPSGHDKQKEIADAFAAKRSRANFNNCAGCIDCMLIWILMVVAVV